VTGDTFLALWHVHVRTVFQVDGALRHLSCCFFAFRQGVSW